MSSSDRKSYNQNSQSKIMPLDSVVSAGGSSSALKGSGSDALSPAHNVGDGHLDCKSPNLL